mgnify:FL=1
MFAKNLFLHNKKNKEQLWVVIAANNTMINMKSLEKHLKLKKDDLRAADDKVMEKILGAKKGSLCLFSLLNDKDSQKVKLIVDERLTKDFEWIGFHPM